MDGLLAYMALDDAPPGPVNLGNPEETTIATLAETIVQLCRSGSSTVFVPLETDDPSRRRPDISRAGDMLGWAPSTRLEDGLGETIGWFRDLLRTIPEHRIDVARP